ncbi:MAG: T9SS type A sorting domain-containing protein [Bacteroidetes bacterium]|nr:T9SS type A sorting domain-containing protein [Bacteroidota bacterium]
MLDYNMGPLTGSICDTLGLSIASNVLVQAHLNAYYHQSWHAIIINADKLKGNRASIRIVNSEGKEVYLSINEKIMLGYLQKNVTLPNIASGIYIVTVTSGGQQLSQKVVVGE